MPITPFAIKYAQTAEKELAQLRTFDQTNVLGGIQKHLQNDPTKTSHSRIKQMDQPFWSKYRLRVGEFRVYYDVDETEKVVTILRIFKKGQRVTPTEGQP